jgi:Glycosyl transferase family 2
MSSPTTHCHILLERLGDDGHQSDFQEIRLFSKCRNERLRLPAFLRHYRNLGAAAFFIVDNGSTDGTTEYLNSQPDVRVFRTDGRFREARGGTDWLNALLSEFGVGFWCLTVDVDELLCYPGSEHASLSKLTRYLESKRYEALGCMLLDLYPNGPLKDCQYATGGDLIAAASYFDIGPYKKVPHQECPGYFSTGGVRERVFYPEAQMRGIRMRIRSALYNRAASFVPILRRSSWLRARRFRASPCLTKIPLVRWDKNSRYLDVNHFVSSKVVAPESGVLLHFKFLQDFHAKAVQEAARGEYFDGASEYQRYAERLSENPELTLMYAGSKRFEGNRQLLELGLMNDTIEWAEARAPCANTT